MSNIHFIARFNIFYVGSCHFVQQAGFGCDGGSISTCGCGAVLINTCCCGGGGSISTCGCGGSSISTVVVVVFPKAHVSVGFLYLMATVS